MTPRRCRNFFHDVVGAFGLSYAFRARSYLLDIHLYIIDGEVDLHGHGAFEVLALPAHLLFLYLCLLDARVAAASGEDGHIERESG